MRRVVVRAGARCRKTDLVQHVRAGLERLCPSHRVVHEVVRQLAGVAEGLVAEVPAQVAELLVEFGRTVADLEHGFSEGFHGFGVDGGGRHGARGSEQGLTDIPPPPDARRFTVTPARPGSLP